MILTLQWEMLITKYQSIKLKCLLLGIKERIVSVHLTNLLLHVLCRMEKDVFISIKGGGWRGCISGHIWVSELRTLFNMFSDLLDPSKAPLLLGSWNVAVIELKVFEKKWKYNDSYYLCCLSYLNFTVYLC